MHSGNGVEPAEPARHGEVQDQDRGPVLSHDPESRRGIRSLGDDLETSNALENHPQA